MRLTCYITRPIFRVRSCWHLAQPQTGRPPLVGCPRLLIQHIRSYPPYWRPFLHPQPEDAPCRGDRDPTYHGFCMSVKLGRSHWRRNVGWGCLRIGFWGESHEVTGKWRKLHNEKLNDLYSPPNIIRVIKSRRMRWPEHVARMGDSKGAYRVLVGTIEGKRSFGRFRPRWKDNIKMDLQELAWAAWTGLIWLRIGTGNGHLWMR